MAALRPRRSPRIVSRRPLRVIARHHVQASSRLSGHHGRSTLSIAALSIEQEVLMPDTDE
jgi:hypothetical protein